MPARGRAADGNSWAHGLPVRAGLTAIKNDKLRHFISVSATDSYRALVAYGEIDPSFENKTVLLATSEDGRPLDSDGPRLVVPGDIAGGRYVSTVNRVFIEKPPL